jgi:hypothetical protein
VRTNLALPKPSTWNDAFDGPMKLPAAGGESSKRNPPSLFALPSCRVEALSEDRSSLQQTASYSGEGE